MAKVEEFLFALTLSFSGGIKITVTGENMDSVAEPIMVVVVVNLLTGDPSIFYQVSCKSFTVEY